MKNSFKEFYLLSEEEFKTLWDECVFVFDSNVLLNLYRYSQKTAEQLLSILGSEKIRDRIWIPHQFAQEYQKIRLYVIYEQKHSYKEILLFIENLIQGHCRHPFLNMREIMQPVKDGIEKKQTERPDWDKEDPIRNSLTELFKGNVGEAFSSEEKEEIYEKGEKRYEEKKPPGYMDEKKPIDERYGDLLGWKQIIKHAKGEKKPIIFITDDKKEDWWWIIKEQTIGPRYELRKEIREEAGVLFYMYNSNGFMGYAGVYLEQRIDEAIITEIKEVAKKPYPEEETEVAVASGGESSENVQSSAIRDVLEENVGESDASQERS